MLSSELNYEMSTTAMVGAGVALAAAAAAAATMGGKKKGILPPDVNKQPKPLPSDYLELRKALSPGATLGLPGEESYSTARLRNSWNYDALGAPSGIVSVAAVEDVVAAVKYAAKHRLDVSVASGRHSHLCMVDDSLVIDMSLMHEVSVDPKTYILTAQGGCRLDEVDAACEPHGVAVTFGHEKSTGLAGLTLHGGHGTLERRWGLTVDHLISCQVVLANGTVVTASAKENPDLFWGLKGGGGNFGIVTEFKFQAFKLPNGGKFLSGNRVWIPFLPFAPKREEALRHCFKVAEKAPDEFSSFFINVAGGPVIATPIWTGDDTKAGQEFIDKNIRNFGFAVADDINSLKSYHKVIQSYASGPDGSGSLPAFDYVKGNLICGKIPEALPEVLTKLAENPPKEVECTHIVSMVGGEAAKVSADASAVSVRDAIFWIISVAKWKKESPELRKKAAEWCRQSHSEIQKVTASSQYGTLPVPLHQDDNDDGEMANAARKVKEVETSTYGDKIGKLRRVKKMYDPNNLFHLNENILPA